MDLSRYPANWNQISLQIRYERANGRCEWCDAPDRTFIQRMIANPAIWRVCDPLADSPHWYSPIRCVLTVHHIGIPKPDGTPGDPHDKMDCRPENLAALCQRCHLCADMPIHVANARKTRAAKKQAARIAAGQLDLFK